MKDNQINLFSTPVWGFVLKDQQYQARDYLEAILTLQETEPSQTKSNFGGYQSHDNLHLVPVFREFTRTLERIASECVQKPLVVSEMWANINDRHCYNGNHTHGGILSGVLYLQCPSNSGRLILCNPAVRSDGHLIRSSNYPITPESLALILFPSWLEHYVEPNQNTDPRISISFNFVLAR